MTYMLNTFKKFKTNVEFLIGLKLMIIRYLPTIVTSIRGILVLPYIVHRQSDA